MVTNMPGTAKVLGLNLTRTTTCFFFQTRNFLSQEYSIKYSASYVCLSVVGLVVISYFPARIFSHVCFTPKICNFTYLDFVSPSFFLLLKKVSLLLQFSCRLYRFVEISLVFFSL